MKYKIKYHVYLVSNYNHNINYYLGIHTRYSLGAIYIEDGYHIVAYKVGYYE